MQDTRNPNEAIDNERNWSWKLRRRKSALQLHYRNDTRAQTWPKLEGRPRTKQYPATSDVDVGIPANLWWWNSQVVYSCHSLSATSASGRKVHRRLSLSVHWIQIRGQPCLNMAFRSYKGCPNYSFHRRKQVKVNGNNKWSCPFQVEFLVIWAW